MTFNLVITLIQVAVSRLVGFSGFKRSPMQVNGRGYIAP